MENVNLNEFDIKVEKIKKLEEMGEKAYKAKFNKTHEIHDLEKYELGTKVSVAGRMTFKRTFGKLIFARLYAIGDNFDVDFSAPIRTSVQISLNFNIVVTRQTKGEEINFSPPILFLFIFGYKQSGISDNRFIWYFE